MFETACQPRKERLELRFAARAIFNDRVAAARRFDLLAEYRSISRGVARQICYEGTQPYGLLRKRNTKI